MIHLPHRRLLLLTGAASVLVALVLIVAKVIAWQMSGSVSLLGSLLDSVVDSLASVINLFAVRYALIPADSDHRWGHGKAEALAGLGQAVFIGISAIVLLWQAVGRVWHPVPMEAAAVGVGVMVFSIVLTGLLLLLQAYTIRRTKSTAIGADHLHYFSDMAVNVGIIIAILLAAAGLPRMDGIIGIAIAVYIFFEAWKLGGETIQLLLDHEMSEDVRTEVASIVAQHDLALGFHDLRTRQSGYTQFIQLHVDMDESLPLAVSHDLAERIELDIKRCFPAADVIIHQDPVKVTPYVYVNDDEDEPPIGQPE